MGVQRKVDSQFFWLRCSSVFLLPFLTKGYCQQTGHTRTMSLKAKIKLVRSWCLYLAEVERQDPVILLDAKHTASIKDFIAASQLTFPIPQSSACDSFAVSSPQALQLIALLESWSSEREYENLSAQIHLCIGTPMQNATPVWVFMVDVLRGGSRALYYSHHESPSAYSRLFLVTQQALHQMKCAKCLWDSINLHQLFRTSANYLGSSPWNARASRQNKSPIKVT